MKKFNLLLTLIVFTITSILAQSPNEFKYQAALRNTDGTIMSEKTVKIDISILQGSATGTEVFTESHNTTTSKQGIINLNIGSVADMSSVKWSEDSYFVKIAVDDIVMGTSQLLSVPYALNSKTAETVANSDNWDKDKSDDFSGSYDDLTNKPTLSTVATSGSYNDLIDKPTSYNSSIDFLSREELNAIVIPTNGQIIYNTSDSITVMWNGQNWIKLMMTGCFPQPTKANAEYSHKMENFTVALNANNPTEGTGIWSIENGSGGSFSNPNSYNSSFTGQKTKLYTLRWTISTVCGSSYDNLLVSVLPQIGDFYAGGVVFHRDESDDIDSLSGLVCAVSDQSNNAEWGCRGTNIVGADSENIGDGSQNTSDIENGCTESGTAADICTNLTLNGYNDWFLPSQNELFTMYQKQYRINSTAVNNGGNNFSTYKSYWSSTEKNYLTAWFNYFDDGTRAYGVKNYSGNVRCVRKF